VDEGRKVVGGGGCGLWNAVMNERRKEECVRKKKQTWGPAGFYPPLAGEARAHDSKEVNEKVGPSSITR
jgi:hypothetical protein